MRHCTLKDEAMRTIVGVIAVLGLAVAVASAQPPRARGASFRPPEPLGANETAAGTVARGASEEFPPSSFPTTPVARPGKAPADARGPAWLSGVDSGVLPAAGSASRSGNVRPLSPAAASAEHREDPFTPPKGLDKLKGAGRAQQASAPQPPEQPTATTPFRGTAADGAPVYAGPPAYRWYGWGTVTPGANQFAPTGQYPKASASWYSITGATPGAFPVPVMNPLRNPPGIDPPAYATAKPATTVASASEPAAPVQQQLPAQVQPQLQPQPRPLPVERPEAPKPSPNAESKFVAPPPPVNVPKLTPPPTTVLTPPSTVLTPPATAPVAVAPVPAPIVPPVVREPDPIVPPAPQKSEPVAFVPPTVQPLAAPSPSVPPPDTEAAPAFPSVEPTKPVVAVPSPLPISLTTEVKPEEPKRPEPKPEPRREEHLWQAAPEPAQPAPGTWTPAGGRPAQPPAAAPTTVPAWKSGAANTKPIVARAQMGETGPDPIETLIRQLCQDRAEGVEVRWSGTKKIMVCFEVRTAPEAQKLVTDISKRPELSQYQIDFCAVLKK
ncbi:hypothetical protein GobsT_29280 [Gemmata obscuriglobus]|uniref:Uncharacterized protein n=1 Tax=Gemmata obscuriglobus TaxID=114 RepID=A0A2Z3H5L1_9BACT|nr:hypothetical protein [Gemmata obscuriglobus]AWM38846.1 hypothetical protein C1280_18905 [Gemmata obscuriglobus]QEG28154.1 hypothetical protein GobsT_29280 [Gemmata obscuriglobus]VTS05843.1 unnamed protein product [Gemmata obscuriglobus UQM 2246]